eukprot:TRINITY_DN1445_c0_g1_i2.p1 TRINITY_DN1445_c0_g1~~TRINITY_DN1445_c0_g1_i2.p1  ORF type:complete len:894 (+),score=180.87 TRINITY_DN1445_c0_g1_i2:189-2870(+)
MAEILEDVLTQIFHYIDGATYRSVSLTCKMWNKIVDQVPIWESILENYTKGISPSASELLERDEEIQSLNEVYGEKDNIEVDENGRALEILKNTYKIVATSLIVYLPTINNPEWPAAVVAADDDDDAAAAATATSNAAAANIEELNKRLIEGTKHHRILRKRRIFSQLKEALDYARPGDYIYISEGKFEEEIVINKPVHIFGSRVKKNMEDGDTGFVLKTRFTQPITWENVIGDGGGGGGGSGGGCQSSLHHSFLTERASVTIINSELNLRRVVFSTGCHVNLKEGASVSIWSSDFRNGERALVFDEKFVSVDITASYLNHSSFTQDDSKLIIKKLESTLVPGKPNPKLVIACCHTLDSIVELKIHDQIRFLLKEEECRIVQLIHNAMQYYRDNDKALFSLVLLFNTILLTEDPELAPIFNTINVIPSFEEMIRRHRHSAGLQEWVSVCLWNLLDQVNALSHFNQSIHHALLESLEIHYKSFNVAFETVSFLWHSAHRLLPIRPLLIKRMALFMKVLDYHKDDRELYHEVMGLVWNLPGNYPPEALDVVVPHVLKSLTLACDANTMNTALGAFLLVLVNCNENHLQYLISNNAISILLDLKDKNDIKGDSSHRLWKSFACLSRSHQAQLELSKLISRERQFPPLSDLDRIRILYGLSLQEQVVHNDQHHRYSIYQTLKSILLNITKDSGSSSSSSEVFFYAMDSTVHLVKNRTSCGSVPTTTTTSSCSSSPLTLNSSSDEMLSEICDLVLKSSTFFLKDRKVSDWLGWAKSYLINYSKNNNDINKNDDHREDEDDDVGEYDDVRLDPLRSVGVHISHDGLTCRHAFTSVFGTAIANKKVSSGKWYYEMHVLTDGLFQIGWSTYKFSPSPQVLFFFIFIFLVFSEIVFGFSVKV